MQVVFGLAGAAVGSLFGNPALGWAVGTLIGGGFGGQEGSVSNLGDQRLQGATNGSPIAIVYGRERVAGNIIYASGITETDDSNSGGKKAPNVQTATQTCSLAIAIARGNPVGRDDNTVRRIWANNEPVWSHRPELGESSPVVSEKLSTCDITNYPGNETQPPDPTIQADKGAANTPAFLGTQYSVLANLLVNNFGSIPNLSFEVDSGEWTLEEVLLDILSMVGIDASLCDFTNLSGITVEGFVIPARVEARAAMGMLCDMYDFDLTEYDGKIRSIVRGGGVDYTIAYDELASTSGKGTGSSSARRVSIVSKQEVELPHDLTVSYHSEGNDFQNATQRAEVRTMFSQEPVTLSFQATLTDERARTIAETRLRADIAGRSDLTFTVTYRFLKSTPGDIVDLEIKPDGTTMTVQLVKLDAVVPGLITVTARSYDPEAYVQSVEAAANDSSPGGVFVPSQTYWVMAEVPAPLDAYADKVYLVVAAGRLDTGWKGGEVLATDELGKDPETGMYGGVNRNSFAKSCTFGEADTALADYTGPGIDYVGTVDVILKGGSPLQSITFDQLLEGKNLAILGQEIINFQTVTDLGDDTYRLSTIRRGRRGTEQAASTHIIGEPFILINGREQYITYKSIAKGSTIDFDFFDFGSAANLGVQTTPTLLCKTRRPYSPVLLTSVRNGGTNDVALSWVRRVRKDGELVDLYDAPLDEDAEVYTLEIWHPSTATILRTVTVSAASTYNYTSAMQTTDLGAPGAFRFRVAQYTTAYSIGNGEFAALVSVA